MKKSKLRMITLIAAVGILMYALSSPSDNKIKHRYVKLSGPHGMCSGEQVRAPSGIDYILSAGHCKDIAENGSFTVTDEDGNVLQRRVIAEDKNSDLLLIEGLPNVRGLDIAKADYSGEHVRTFTHGNRMDTYKTEGELIQNKRVQILKGVVTTKEEEDACTSMPKNKIEQAQTFFSGPINVCVMNIMETASTATIVPGSSGGMVVDDQGKLVGVASCVDSQNHFNYFVSLHDIQVFLSGY